MDDKPSGVGPLAPLPEGIWPRRRVGARIPDTNVKPHTRSDVAIVGAGIVGLFCAYFLARRGLTVVVLERKLPGAGSSTRSGGGIRSQFGTVTNVRLAVLSEPYWAEFEDRFGVDVGLHRIGYLFLAEGADELETVRKQVRLQRGFGIPSELLSAEDVSARWPSLDGVDVSGAGYCATDGYLNQHRALRGIAQAAETAGATIECGIEVTGFEVEADRIEAVRTTNGTIAADVFVNCAGAWAPHVAKAIGVDLPIRGRRVQLLLARPTEPLPPDLPWLIGPLGQVHIRQDVGGRVLVGGFLGGDETVDPSAFDNDADSDWIAAVLEQVSRSFRIEIERSAVIESWAGLYPSTPDQHPIVDRIDGGMVVVGGFAGLGLMHAPAAGLLASELIVDGGISSIDPGELSLARFSKALESVERTGF
jgi:sarcosine oxidase subunit beta